MRISVVSMTVVAVSALGLTTVTVDMAKAYVARNPGGNLAPFAVQMLVEIESRRSQAYLAALGGAPDPALVSQLVFRARDKWKVQRVYDDYGSGGDGNALTFPSLYETRDRKPGTTERVEAQRAAQYLQIQAKKFQSEIGNCPRPPPLQVYLDCIAGAVDAYARRIELMPPTPASVAPVAVPALREAADRIRTARDIAGARRAVAGVVAAVRKSIDLVQAGGDDAVRRLELGQRSVILSTMSVLDDDLVQAIGI